MRRLIAAAALCGAALLAAGCTDGTVTPSPSSTGSAPSATTSGPTDPKAQAICDDLRQNILNTDATVFGTELGKMINARARGNKAEETRAQAAAVAKLKEISAKLRANADQATSPRLKTALTTSADNLEKVAADTGNFSNLNSLDSVSQTTQKFSTALADIADYCTA